MCLSAADTTSTYAHATPYTQNRHFFVANTSSYRLASGGCTLLRAVGYHCSGPSSIYCPTIDRAEAPLWCARDAHGTGRLIDPCFTPGFFSLVYFVLVFSFFRVCCQAKTKKKAHRRDCPPKIPHQKGQTLRYHTRTFVVILYSVQFVRQLSCCEIISIISSKVLFIFCNLPATVETGTRRSFVAFIIATFHIMPFSIFDSCLIMVSYVKIGIISTSERCQDVIFEPHFKQYHTSLSSFFLPHQVLTMAHQVLKFLNSFCCA